MQTFLETAVMRDKFEGLLVQKIYPVSTEDLSVSYTNKVLTNNI